MLVFENEFALAVVVLVFFPFHRGVAFVTFLAKDAAVVVVETMAGIASLVRLGFVNRLQVTLGTFDLGVLVLEGELALAMVVTAFFPAF